MRVAGSLEGMSRSYNVWYRIGAICGRYPLQIVAINFIVCIFLFSYFCFFPLVVDTDIRRGFAHRNGRAAQEFEAFGNFYNVTTKNLELVILVFLPKNSAPLMDLNLELLNEVKRTDQYLRNLSVAVPPEFGLVGNTLRLGDTQASRGNVNFLFDAFKLGLEMQEAVSSDSNILLDYPISQIYGHKFPIRSHFFDVQLYNDSQAHMTSLKSVGMIALWYMLEVGDIQLRPFLQKLEVTMYELSQRKDFSPLFDFCIYGDEIANYEMMQGSKRTFNLLAIGMLIMIAFMIVVLRDFHWREQLVLLSAAIVSPFFAIGATISAMCWAGIQLNSLMSIMPFLILGIGVDDSFLLIHAWRKIRLASFPTNRSSNNNSPTIDTSDGSSKEATELESDDRQLNLLTDSDNWTEGGGLVDIHANRVATIVEEVGPSVFITSFTNMLAFGSGFFSPSSQLSIFCLSTSLAVLFNFYFQFTLFLPCMVFAGRVAPALVQKFSPSEDKPDRSCCKLPLLRSWSFWDVYARVLVSRRILVFCAALLIFMYVAAFLGAYRMRPTFKPQKTFPKDSPLQTSVRAMNRLILQYSPVSFIVNKPPNISDLQEYGEFRRMTDSLSALSNVTSLDLWLNDYIKYRRDKTETNRSADNKSSRDNYELVPSFLSDFLLNDKHIVLWHRDQHNSVIIDKFVFTLVCQGKSDWHERAFFVDELRAIVDAHPQFNVTVFDYDSTIYDLIIAVKAEMIKSILVTLTCMTVVCAFVIVNAKFTAVAVLSVFSTSFTLLGMLSWWGLDLDPVTLVAFLMAIGLSVDATAHICYHFYKLDCIERQQYRDFECRRYDALSAGEGGEKSPSSEWKTPLTPLQKNQIILNAVGKPMIEASISTIICMLPLFFIPIYVVGSFAKTVVAVGLLSAVHGLFVVPVLLSTPALLFRPPQKSSTNSKNSFKKSEETTRYSDK